LERVLLGSGDGPRFNGGKPKYQMEGYGDFNATIFTHRLPFCDIPSCSKSYILQIRRFTLLIPLMSSFLERLELSGLILLRPSGLRIAL
jgi:hypothetical protein